MVHPERRIDPNRMLVLSSEERCCGELEVLGLHARVAADFLRRGSEQASHVPGFELCAERRRVRKAHEIALGIVDFERLVVAAEGGGVEDAALHRQTQGGVCRDECCASCQTSSTKPTAVVIRNTTMNQNSVLV